MKTILFLLPSGLTVRNLLFTGVVEKLLAREDVRVVALTRAPEMSHQYPVRGERLLIEPFPNGSWYTPVKVVHAVLRQRFCRINETGSTRILSEGPLSAGQGLLETLLSQPLPRSRRLYRWIRALEEPLSRVSPEIRELFDRCEPHLVVSTNPTTTSEYGFLKYAKTTGITSVGIIKSWDVLTMKGYIPVPLDYYLVWNSIMKEELIRLHQVAPDKLGTTGIPHFDVYADNAGARPRETFFRTLGLDPTKKTVLFATSSRLINPDDPAILQRLAVGLREEPSVQILARLHPLDSLARYRGLAHPNLAFQVPGAYRADGDRRLLDSGFLTELRDTLLHSDVVVNTSSTMSLDAVAMDKPVVNISFDLEPKDYNKSRRRYYDLDHYRPIVEAGATRIAWNADEFVPLIMRYLNNPELESVQRARLRETMCYKVDGRSAERMAAHLICALDGKPFDTVAAQV